MGKGREGERKQRIINQKEEFQEETTDHKIFNNHLSNSGKREIFLEEKLKYYRNVHTDMYEIRRHSVMIASILADSTAILTCSVVIILMNISIHN